MSNNHKGDTNLFELKDRLGESRFSGLSIGVGKLELLSQRHNALG
jgi:hypothetical protein